MHCGAPHIAWEHAWSKRAEGNNRSWNRLSAPTSGERPARLMLHHPWPYCPSARSPPHGSSNTSQHHRHQTHRQTQGSCTHCTSAQPTKTPQPGSTNTYTQHACLWTVTPPDNREVTPKTWHKPLGQACPPRGLLAPLPRCAGADGASATLCLSAGVAPCIPCTKGMLLQLCSRRSRCCCASCCEQCAGPHHNTVETDAAYTGHQ